MGTYLVIGLVLAGLVYRKKLWEIFMTVIMWPWTLIEALKRGDRSKADEEA